MTMKEMRLIMGMPITVEVTDQNAAQRDLDDVFAYFAYVDDTFSTYKETSEISRLNRGELTEDECSQDVRTILALAEQTRRETDGYFDIRRDGAFDPSGIVKGWAVQNAADLLAECGFRDFYVDAGGDIQVSGTRQGNPWRAGIRNPFDRREIVKVLALRDCGVATSGTAVRGQHIYNPHKPGEPIHDVISLTVVGPNVYEADRFATAAFAMGPAGIQFIQKLSGFEGYLIDARQRATYTTGFERYVLQP
jgi:FAD:protein FMN transferase